MIHRYLIAIGSNVRVAGVGGPHRVVDAAVLALAEVGEVAEVSRTRSSRPIGPSLRSYANAAAVVESESEPAHFLARLQQLEFRFGRRRRGAPWRARSLDLDIVLWSGGVWLTPDLVIPHPLFRERPFVSGPAAEVAPHWRDPVTGLSLRQLASRLAHA
ncbi:2-amino-4-hydroxy-6-hydroxymethyldihydropteridine diphosphokinase [Qipengyuania vulgaris]|uniref:2-amino-4-hydroxy-6- hydroxymethyldihydropteridine diphosphokinase n=1 Tax=Qipengyuania vulgaris TaxID=291985 RepID=UPI00301E3F4F